MIKLELSEGGILMTRLIENLRDENGQSMVEYGLIIGLIAVIVIGALLVFGPLVRDMYIIDISGSLE